MKFLIDAQLPRRLAIFLNSNGLDCIHTLDLPEKNNSTDQFIISFAQSENRVVVTKDDDFLQSHILFSKPKKLILVKTGNISNNELLILFEKNFLNLQNLLENNNLIEITRNEIVTKT